jgi:acyl-CoA reductase-like NAD-dependent aldehyde dehydrogenase
MIFKTINPYNQNIIAEYEAINDIFLENTIAQAKAAQRHWSRLSFEERGNVFKKLAHYLRENKTDLATLLTTEMGKILPESMSEIEKCAVQCEYFSQNAEGMLQEQIVATDAQFSSIRHEPVGVVLAIMPWNFPFWQVFRYSIPALMAGNVTILKHAPNVFGCALAIEKAFQKCLNEPALKGVFQTIVADINAVQKLIADDRINMVTLTGSERAGASVAQLAGLHIKKSVLELGGNDALIVLHDADLEKAAAAAVQSRMMNAGQVCIAAKRFLVQKSIKNEFTDRVLALIKNLKQGDPMHADTKMGPLARLDLAQTLNNQVQKTIAQGGRLLYGGVQDGCHFQPTLFDNITPFSVAFLEETFGPVAAISVFEDEKEAVDLANNSRYGLSAAIWTQDLDKAKMMSRDLEVGSVFVNTVVRSDARLPIGGIKKSGYGRELSEVGLKEFCQTKTLFIA